MTSDASLHRAVIIGGGIGGLTAAYRLLQKSKELNRPVDVTLLEGSSRLGGVIMSEEREGFVLEWGPDCFISEKPAAIKLAKELGLEDELVGTQSAYRHSFILIGKKLVPIPRDFYLMAPRSILPFVTSTVMSWPGKIRCFMDVFIPRRVETGDETLANFVRRRLGREALERIAQPLVAGIYTADPEQLSLAATMPRFLEWEQKYGSVILGLRKTIKKTHGAGGPRYGLFVTLRHGLKTLTETLERKIPSECLRRNTTVKHLDRVNGAWSISLNSGEKLTADSVFLALPGHASAKLLAAGAPDVANTLSTVPYASTGIMNLGFRTDQIRHPLNGMGLVIPSTANRSLIAVSFSHRKFAHRAPEGFALLRAFIGGAMHEKILDFADAELKRRVLNDLREMLVIDGDPLFSDVRRWNKSMPQYTLNHLDRIGQLEKLVAATPGLYLVGNAFRGVGIPDTIACAETAVDRFVATMKASARP